MRIIDADTFRLSAIAFYANAAERTHILSCARLPLEEYYATTTFRFLSKVITAFLMLMIDAILFVVARLFIGACDILIWLL